MLPGETSPDLTVKVSLTAHYSKKSIIKKKCFFYLRGEGTKNRRGEKAKREGAKERRSEGASTGCGKYRVSVEVEFLFFQIAMKVNWCEMGFSIMKAS